MLSVIPRGEALWKDLNYDPSRIASESDVNQFRKRVARGLESLKWNTRIYLDDDLKETDQKKTLRNKKEIADDYIVFCLTAVSDLEEKEIPPEKILPGISDLDEIVLSNRREDRNGHKLLYKIIDYSYVSTALIGFVGGAFLTGHLLSDYTQYEGVTYVGSAVGSIAGAIAGWFTTDLCLSTPFDRYVRAKKRELDDERSAFFVQKVEELLLQY